MPVPRHTTALAHVQLRADPALDGVTELRVHGVGGTPPDATLGDLAPEQVSGDAVAGFYRSSDHHASEKDRAQGADVDRHVEVYSWGGLTSRSRTRVLWLALLPFLLGNLAGWMCSAATRKSPWQFRLHRLASGLGALALTANAVLVAAMIGADVLAYQTVRGAHAAKPVKGGFVAGQGWLAPLRWSFIAGHPGRQILIGVLAAEVLVLVLLVLGIRSWRYESVRPPVHQLFHGPARKKTAAALARGLEDEKFWDGAPSVRLASWLHVSVATGLLALFLSGTGHAATGPGSAAGWWWTAIGLGGATIAVAVIYLMLDALDALPDALREVPVYVMLAMAALALIAAGIFAWRQPANPAAAPGPAQLPGLSTLIGWTALAVAASLALVLISTLIGFIPRGRGTLTGGPWVTLMLAFGLLGSPVVNLYQWGFPGYVPERMLKDLAPDKGGGITAWKNVYYPTDPIGGPVGIKAVDEPKSDPAQCWYVYGQRPPSPAGHSGYWADSRVWDLVNEAAVRAAPPRPAHGPNPLSNGHDSRRWRGREAPRALRRLLGTSTGS